MRLWQLYLVVILAAVLLLLGLRAISPTSGKIWNACDHNPTDEHVRAACAGFR